MRQRRPYRLAHAGLWWLFAASLPACQSAQSPGAAACLPALPRDCVPLYDPTWQNLFDNRVGPTCGASTTGSSCHSEKGAMAGLVMQQADEAYDHLLGNKGNKVRVIPNDPECSLLMERLSSDNPSYRMPPGSMKLSDGERCAFELWIAEGAKR